MVEGIAWKPLHPEAVSARQLSTTWSLAGAGVAGAVFVLGFVVVGLTDGFSGGLVALLAAAAAGIVLVVVGLGMLQLEALRAEAVAIPVAVEGHMRSLAEGAPPAVLGPEALKELRQGLAGLTAARAAVFAGAFLLAVAALGGGLSLAGDEEGSSSEPSPSPTATVTVTPSPTSTATASP